MKDRGSELGRLCQSLWQWQLCAVCGVCDRGPCLRCGIDGLQMSILSLSQAWIGLTAKEDDKQDGGYQDEDRGEDDDGMGTNPDPSSSRGPFDSSSSRSAL